MYLLHQIGERINPNFNTLEEILASEGPISFDGVYESVYKNYKALRGKDVTFFVTGKYIGSDNAFDVHNGQPLSKFCTKEQILEMAEYLTARVGYHSWSHINPLKIQFDDTRTRLKEMIIPVEMREWVDPIYAYPFGDYTQMDITQAKALGYHSAYSAMQGDNRDLFTLKRNLLNW